MKWNTTDEQSFHMNNDTESHTIPMMEASSPVLCETGSF
jgi:hypothetical protein